MPSVAERRRYRWSVVLLAFLGLSLAAADAPQAARAAADVVLVREGEVVEEDLYAGGNVVTIEGEIEGDLIVWAFDRLDVSGEVRGDIVGFAATARITGNVDGSVRLVGADVSTAGQVGGDVFAVAWNVVTGGSVGRDVLVWGRSLSVQGTVGRDVEGQTWGPTTISGSVGRDVEMTVQQMTVTDGAFIAQDLGFRSNSQATIGAEAEIGGAVIRRSPVAPNVSVSAARFVTMLLGFLAFLWLGILSIWMMPSTVQRAVVSVRTNPSRSFFVGLVAIVTPIILLGAVFLIAAMAPPELALTILVVGAPFWLGLLVMVLLATLMAPVPVFIVVGRRLSRDRLSAFAAFALLSIPLALVLFLPYVRVVVVVGVTTVGIGALARGAIQSRGSIRWAVGEVHQRPPRSRHRRSSDDEDSAVLHAVDDGDASDQ